MYIDAPDGYTGRLTDMGGLTLLLTIYPPDQTTGKPLVNEKIGSKDFSFSARLELDVDGHARFQCWEPELPSSVAEPDALRILHDFLRRIDTVRGVNSERVLALV